MDAENSIRAFEKLNNFVPSIGFLSRKKRIQAFMKVTEQAQLMLESEEINEEEALFIFSLLMRKNNDFNKSALMTGLSLARIDSNALSAIGFKYANIIRTNLRLVPIGDDKSLEA